VVLVAHLVLGLALVAMATTVLMRRDNLARKERAGGRVAAGRAGWTVVGVILALSGLLQLLTAVGYAI
jgi:hypothetical protein